MDETRADALITEIGHFILEDPELVSNPWDQTVFVAVLDSEPNSIFGFRYVEEAAYPTTPTAIGLLGAVKELREVTAAPDGSKWNAMIVWIEEATLDFDIEFEQGSAESLRLTPSNYDTLAETLRR